MASGGFQGSRTFLSQPVQERTLVLRSAAYTMRDELEQEVENRVKEFKDKFNKDTSDQEIDDFIENAFFRVEGELKCHLDNMKVEVKSHAPKKPVKKLGQSDKEYQEAVDQYEQEKEDYISYVSYVSSLLQGLAGLFSDIFKSVREFFSSLWTYIKQALKDVAKKISSFLRYLKEKISNGIEALFR